MMTKIAFMSPHCLVDFTNGAAIATREGLKLLAAQGFQCMAFCGTRLDEAGEGLIQEQLFRRKINYEVRKARLVVPGGEQGAGSGEQASRRSVMSTAADGTRSGPATLADGTGTVPATLKSPHPSPLPEGEGTRAYDARLIFMVDGNSHLAGALGLDSPFADASGCDGGTVPVTMFENGSTRGGWLGPQEVEAFLAACEIFLKKNRPDIVITYGGDSVSIAVQRLAKKSGAIVVFWLRNFSYHNRAAFEAVDCVIVPSEFSKRYYKEKLGLECNVLPSIVQWRGEEKTEVRSQKSEVRMVGNPPAPGSPLPAKYVTFINPEGAKGVYVFARIAQELAARRPDIPLLVVQGRSGADALRNPALGLAEHIAGEKGDGPFARASGLWSALADASGCDCPRADAPEAAQPAKAGTPARNITMMPFTPNPGDFYPITKLLLMPSLWNESFGLVAVEAMLNGIPVLASNRGALPETIGGSPQRPTVPVGARPLLDSTRPHPSPLPEGEGTSGGFLFDIPARYTPATREVPTAEEVAPWVATIIRLWDDAAEYERASRAARERAQAWHPDRLAIRYRDFFRCVSRQPDTQIVVGSAAG